MVPTEKGATILSPADPDIRFEKAAQLAAPARRWSTPNAPGTNRSKPLIYIK